MNRPHHSASTDTEKRSTFDQEVLAASHRCALCGTCQKECPVYGARRREGLSARGRLRLLTARFEGYLDKNTEKALAEAADQCMLCGRCSKNCPNDVPGMETFKAARAFFAETGVSAGMLSPRRLLLARMLPSPRLFRAMLALCRSGKPLLDQLLTRFSGLSMLLPLLAGAEKLPPVASHAALFDVPDEVAGPAGAPRVALFSGCLGTWMRPGLLRATIRSLSRRFTVSIPKLQGCCGLPALSGGFPEAATLLMERNIEALMAARADLIVTPCASCAHTLAHETPGRVSPAMAEKAALLAPKVRELSLLMAEEPGLCLPAGKNGSPVFVHVPCHLSVSFGVSCAPGDVLRRAGIDTFTDGGEQCCGGGALVPQLNPGLSTDVFQRARAAFNRSGAAIVATECSGCFIQWTRCLPTARVLHPVELLFAERS